MERFNSAEIEDKDLKEIVFRLGRGKQVEIKDKSEETLLSNAVKEGEVINGIPNSLDDLPYLVSQAYDLSVTMAADLNIPVIASVSGGHNRRVLILERSAYKPIIDKDITKNYGYAIRLVITVNKWDASSKLNLPFIAASAQLNSIEAKWMLQVIGLAGRVIAAVLVPPTDLNVETFVLAKQSLTNIIGAMNDPSTKFIPEVISIERHSNAIQLEYKKAIAKTVALSGIKDGRSLDKIIQTYSQNEQSIVDTIADVYRNFAGVVNDQDQPKDLVRKEATVLLAGLNIKF
jgi:hypothetical protein